MCFINEIGAVLHCHKISKCVLYKIGREVKWPEIQQFLLPANLEVQTDQWDFGISKTPQPKNHKHSC